MKLVAFAGPAGSGKSSAASHLVRDHSYERLSFAAPLYDMLEAGGFGRPKTQEEKEAIIPHLGISWRHAAQTLGTEWGRRMIHPDVWVLSALSRMFPQGNYVIEDLRFENEASAVRKAGGLIVHLIGRKHDMTQATSGHASEAGVIFEIGDGCLLNTGSLKDFYSDLDAVLYGLEDKG